VPQATSCWARQALQISPWCSKACTAVTLPIFAYPKRPQASWYIKRVIGLPGIVLKSKDQQSVNGQTLQRATAPSSAGTVTGDDRANRQWQCSGSSLKPPQCPPAKLPPLKPHPDGAAQRTATDRADGQVFVLGDNRFHPIASTRAASGTVPLQDILGGHGKSVFVGLAGGTLGTTGTGAGIGTGTSQKEIQEAGNSAKTTVTMPRSDRPPPS